MAFLEVVNAQRNFSPFSSSSLSTSPSPSLKTLSVCNPYLWMEKSSNSIIFYFPMVVSNHILLFLPENSRSAQRSLDVRALILLYRLLCFTSLVIVSIFADAHIPWDDLKLVIGIWGWSTYLLLGLVGKAVPGSTPRPLEMLGGDQRLVDHPVAKSNSGEETESLILAASLGIFDVPLS
jgi:hypothetical protein